MPKTLQWHCCNKRRVPAKALGISHVLTEAQDEISHEGADSRR